MVNAHFATLILLRSPNKQSGVVLIVSLVFLFALTAVVVALMQNTSTDMKMSGASQDKLVALQEAQSEVDNIIYNQVRKVNGTNGFTSALALFPLAPTVTKANVITAKITIVNPSQLIADCPHAFAASSVQVFKCNVLNVNVVRRYGRTYNSAIEINAGITQQLINGGN
ncbi:pilus assembly PilX family protein [Cognaticolwellia mytili]|uniref:pilus assembly PilX family protein n=1 Tax=Cognaticolwellia mytili TaxID=1888913 RepID=UPI000A1756A6|nr:pilus assembly PilX N-terminal domain-containing protein [Cognaticolwellia mytili]